jgi:predicted nucleic acid-binding protein
VRLQPLVLDTNALSAMAEGVPAALKRFNASEIALPVIVIGEYRFGILPLRNRADRERWLREMISVSRVLEVTEDTSLFYAEIRAELESIGRPIPSNDTWIAALCRQHSLTLMSKDRHFDEVQGLKRIDW